MKAKPVIPRALASQDAENASSYYLSEDAKQAAPGHYGTGKGLCPHWA